MCRSCSASLISVHGARGRVSETEYNSSPSGSSFRRISSPASGRIMPISPSTSSKPATSRKQYVQRVWSATIISNAVPKATSCPIPSRTAPPSNESAGFEKVTRPATFARATLSPPAIYNLLLILIVILI